MALQPITASDQQRRSFPGGPPNASGGGAWGPPAMRESSAGHMPALGDGPASYGGAPPQQQQQHASEGGAMGMTMPPVAGPSEALMRRRSRVVSAPGAFAGAGAGAGGRQSTGGGRQTSAALPPQQRDPLRQVSSNDVAAIGGAGRARSAGGVPAPAATQGPGAGYGPKAVSAGGAVTRHQTASSQGQALDNTRKWPCTFHVHAWPSGGAATSLTTRPLPCDLSCSSDPCSPVLGCFSSPLPPSPAPLPTRHPRQPVVPAPLGLPPCR